MSGTGSNDEQQEYWTQQAGPKWVAQQSFLDPILAPLGMAGMDRLGDIEGGAVLDVGCGCGDTTYELSRRVGPSGSVVGADLSETMLEQARRAGTQSNLSFVQADAQSHRFDRNFDAVFSRFGVMFFSDPTAAFTNLRAAMRPGGRLSFVCWQALDRNQWFTVPLAAALQHVEPPDPPEPGAPGPFAFADEKRVAGILRDAGFASIDIANHDEVVTVGEGRGIDELTDTMLQVGIVARLVQDASEEAKARVAVSVREALEAHADGGVVRMNSATWLVAAIA